MAAVSTSVVDTGGFDSGQRHDHVENQLFPVHDATSRVEFGLGLVEERSVVDADAASAVCRTGRQAEWAATRQMKRSSDDDVAMERVSRQLKDTRRQRLDS